MKKLVIFVLLTVNLVAQPDTLWTKTFGGTDTERGNFVQKTTDNGLIIVGETQSLGEGGRDIWLIKTDSEGNEQWNRSFGGTQNDVGLSVQQTSDGGYAIVGYTNSNSAGASDIWFIKTDPEGGELWNRMYGELWDEVGNFFIQTTDGGYLIIGYKRLSGWGDRTDIWLIKTDHEGNEQWNRSFGEIYHNYGYCVRQTNDDGYIIVGKKTIGIGNDDIWLIKTDFEGNEQWSRTFGGNQEEEGYSVQQTLDDGYILTGYTESYGVGARDIWLIKTDSMGIEEWNETFGGAENDYGKSVRQISGGGFILTGNISSFGMGDDDVILVKVDSNGNEQWNRIFGGYSGDNGNSIQQLENNSYIIAGTTVSFGSGQGDIWLLNIESDYGCTDSLAINFDENSYSNDDSCDYIGCTDELAINYDPQATINDDSCYYLSDIEQRFQQNWMGIPLNPMGIYINSAILDDINLRVGDEIAVFDGSECVGMIQLTDEITSPLQIFLSEDNPDTPEIDGFISGDNISYKFWDANEQVEVININYTLLNGNDAFTPLGFSEVELQVNTILGCTEINSINYNPDATVNDGTCIPTIIGCMDIHACNFDPDANVEGDCLFYDCAQICDGSSYVDGCDVCDDDPSNDNECFGCMDQWALNYDPASIISDDSCEYPSIGDISMDGFINVNDIVLLVGVVLDSEYYIEYMDINQDSYLNIIDIVILVDIILHPEFIGCTDPDAQNYNPEAFYEDGNCEYSCIDIDGNSYETIVIGNQIWMAENLRVTHYINGEEILTGFNDNDWGQLLYTGLGAYAIFDDDSANAYTYGNLYNWYAVNDAQGICPDNWHVPSDEEFMELETELGMSDEETNNYEFRGTNEGSKLAGDANLWDYGDLVTNEEFGTSNFSALAAGYRNGNNGAYLPIGQYCFYWSSTTYNYIDAVYRHMDFRFTAIYREKNKKSHGFSIRCIKD
jgi:uncharacterized protein (TIGR02145 family)